MKLIRSLRKSSTGAVAAITAIVLPVLLGFGSLGVEVGHWFLAQRVMQGAADAAAISATAQYVKDYNAGKQTSTLYQTVGVQYAGLNGFTIPPSYVCLVDPSGVDGCGAIEAFDPRPVICHTPPCIVVEITQNTATWLSTEVSTQPNGAGRIKAIPTPTLMVRAVVSAKSQLNTTTSSDCILALANDPQAIYVHGGGDPQAKCGIAIDGGIDQKDAFLPSPPVQGGITFSGNVSRINVNRLTVAAPTANCPDDGTHCQLFGSTAPLPASAVVTNTPTADPYAPQIAKLFQTPPPAGVSLVSIKTTGAGYSDPPAPATTCTFTVQGGTFYTAANTPAIFTATVSKGKVTKFGTILDPGAYTTLPSGSVSAQSNCDKSGNLATFILTEGCWTWNGTAIAGRKYCSIDLGGGTTNFPAGSYWIAGGDACAGFCLSSAQATVTSDAAGVTFFLTNGEGAAANSLATVSITSGNVTLCAPGTNCGTSCTNAAGPVSCMLFIQNPAVPCEQQHTCESTAYNTPPKAINSFTGNGSRTLAGLIYLPKQTFSEGGSGPILGCVAVIAKYFDIGGSPIFSDGCLPGDGIGSTTVTTTLSNPHLSQ
jgi:hypothetical protein